MRIRPRVLRRAALLIPASGLVWLCGCAANAPWLHHADEKPFYESTYFRIPSPKGSGWKVIEERPSTLLERYGFHFDADLFDEYVPPRLRIEKYSVKDVFPQPTHDRTLAGFYSTFSRPGLEGNSPRELARSENRRALARLTAAVDTLVDPKWALERSGVGTIGGRDYHEFVMSNGGSGTGRRYLFQYVWFAMDFGVVCVAYVPSLADTLPIEAKRVLETVESVEPEKTPADLAMERAAEDVYELTLKRFGGRSLVVYPGETQSDLRDALRAEPERKKVHLFLGAMQILTEDLGPVIGRPGDVRVKLGLWDFYCVLPSGSIVHSLFDGYSLLDETLEEFRAELEVNPRSFWANYYLAGLYVRHDRYAEAEAQARLLTEYHPESALAWYTLGIAHKRADNKYAARIAFKTALQYDRGEFTDRWSKSFPAGNLIKAQLQSLER